MDMKKRSQKFFFSYFFFLFFLCLGQAIDKTVVNVSGTCKFVSPLFFPQPSGHQTSIIFFLSLFFQNPSYFLHLFRFRFYFFVSVFAEFLFPSSFLYFSFPFSLFLVFFYFSFLFLLLFSSFLFSIFSIIFSQRCFK